MGVAARISGNGKVLGYFFGPRRKTAPSIEKVCQFRPGSEALTCKFGDLGLIDGEWAIIGHDPNWSRDEWPLPAFYRVDEDARKAWKVTYSDTLELVKDVRVKFEEAEGKLRDFLAGSGAVEIRLTKLMS